MLIDSDITADFQCPFCSMMMPVSDGTYKVQKTSLKLENDALRQLGNIGAHMEKDTDVIVDIDTDEADA